MILIKLLEYIEHIFENFYFADEDLFALYMFEFIMALFLIPITGVLDIIFLPIELIILIRRLLKKEEKE